jgi:hypothetical protein
LNLMLESMRAATACPAGRLLEGRVIGAFPSG